MNKRTLRAAIGVGHCASLILRTARASVEIVRHEPGGRRRAVFYTVQGDVTLEERNAARVPMTADKAHALALRCLAAYNRG
jgi:hypothetical protein